MGRRYLATLLRVYADRLLLSDDILAERLAHRMRGENRVERLETRLNTLTARVGQVEEQLQGAADDRTSADEAVR